MTDFDGDEGPPSSHSPGEHEIREWFIAAIGAMLDVPAAALDTSVPFAELGLTSRHGVQMAAELSTWLGERVAVATVFDYPTIDSMAHFLSSVHSSAVPGASSQRDHEEEELDDELAQLLLLLDDSDAPGNGNTGE